MTFTTRVNTFYMYTCKPTHAYYVKRVTIAHSTLVNLDYLPTLHPNFTEIFAHGKLTFRNLNAIKYSSFFHKY